MKRKPRTFILAIEQVIKNVQRNHHLSRTNAIKRLLKMF